MTKVKKENYIALQGWMLTDLKLKGNELIIYACIYGFTQAENQVFTGSLQYLADWTNSTKQGVIKCLKSLVEKGLIVKQDHIINGVKFCEYRTTELTTVLNTVKYPTKQGLMGDDKQSLTNNKDKDNLLKNINNIIDHLNAKAGTSYRASSKATQGHINARLSEGYTVEDFYTVIDKKCLEWKGSDMEKYLRPETLFGSKFENYLNAPVTQRKGVNGVAVAESKVDDFEGIF
jgi:uncharacterized phage protein (TIGR02220 family)